MLHDYKIIFEHKWIAQGGLCFVCKKYMSQLQPQLAHVAINSKQNLKKYGDKIINHPLNLRLVCSLDCNSKVIIPNHKTELFDRHINSIKAIL